MNSLDPLKAFRVGPYVIDGRAHEVSTNGKRVPLSNTEFGIFYQIVENKGNVVLRDAFKACAGRYYRDQRHQVDSHVSQIRKKLGKSIIVGERGKGYRLSPKFAVEAIPHPSLSKLEKQLSIALNQIGDHTSPSFQAAIENCEDLLRADKIPDAYVALAVAHINLGHVGFCRELPSIATKKARRIIDEALREFPELGSAYALRGLTSLIYDYDWVKAENDFRKALKLNQQNVYGHSFLAHLQVARGQFEEGLKHARIVAELDYQNPLRAATKPLLMVFAGRFEDAVIEAEKVVRRFAQCAPAHSILGHAYRAVGATERATAQSALTTSIAFSS